MSESSQGMHPEDIKAEIRKRGTNMTALATMWGFHPATVRNVFNHRMPHVEERLANFLDRKKHELFPDRYDKNDIRIRPISNRSKPRSSRMQSHCKKSSSQFTSPEKKEG